MWIKVHNLAPYIASGIIPKHNGSTRDALSRRVYSLDDGSEYPIMFVWVIREVQGLCTKSKTPIIGVRIVPYLIKTGDMDCLGNPDWDHFRGYLPVELFDDVKQMIDEAKAELERRNGAK